MKSPAVVIPEIEAMRDGIDHRFPISCRKLKFTVRPLSAMEIIQVAQEVADEMLEMPEQHRLGVTESLKMATKTLEKASTPDPETHVPTITVHILSKCTADEINHFHKQYTAVCDKVNPSLEEMPADVVAQMAEEVKKSPNVRLALIGRSFSDLVNLCRLLVEESAT